MRIKPNSIITCPECGFSKEEVMPTDSCQFFYHCTNCGTRLKAKPGDCCVFCSYGDTKCPSIQERDFIEKQKKREKNWKDAPDSELVCYCKEVSKGTIVSAIKNGANTLKDIQKRTTACTGNECKTKNPSGKCCSGDIKELIKMYGNSADQQDEYCCCCGGEE